MKLPNPSRAEVAPEKIRDYLLSSRHRVGRFKARYFRSLGYTTENWQRLANDLRSVAQGEAEFLVESPYGRKFSILAHIIEPNGRTGSVVTIWIVESRSDRPRFVTAFPTE